MSNARTKSAAVSVLTAGSELVLFTAASLFFAGPLLLALRWIVGLGGASANFVLNRRWVFAQRGNAARNQALRYAATALTGVTLATLLLGALSSWTGLDPRVLHLVSMISVWMVFTYPAMKRWVFARRADDAAPKTA